MEEILAKEGREGFAAGWLRHHGYGDTLEEMSDGPDA